MLYILSEKKIEKFLLFCIFIGILLHIIPYFYHRSLWIDEAMLVSSICTRSFSTLIATPLDWGQSSPIGWLFIVKLLTSLFGTSVTVLRMWSLISCIISMFLIYLILKGKVKDNYALLITAIFMITNMFIYYGNEAKPYMSDNMFCLLTLFIWQKYKENKISLWICCLFYSFILWFSFISIFFIASCMLIELVGLSIESVKRKNISFYKYLSLSLVLISFIANYYVWISKSAGNAGGAEYWANLKFPLIPKSLSDIKLSILLIRQLVGFYPLPIAFLFICLNVYYIFNVTKTLKDQSGIILPFIVSLILLFVASSLGYYPIQDRLVQIYSILCIIIVGFSLDDLYENKIISNNIFSIKLKIIIYYFVLAFCLAIIGMIGCKNLFPRHIYIKGEEISKSYNYLKHNIINRDVIYVDSYSIPVFTYINSYQTKFSDLESSEKKDPEFKLNLPQKIGNIIYGQPLFSFYNKAPFSYDGENNKKAANEDAVLIAQNPSVYIFTSHGEAGIDYLLSLLKSNGKIETVVDYYDTHLYHYQKYVK